MSSLPSPLLDAPRRDAFALGPTLELARGLWLLHDAVDDPSRRVAERLGLGDRERLALRLAGKFPDLSAGTLARLLGVGPPRARGVIRRLRRRGLVTLRRDPRRARRTLIELTPAGRGLDVPASCGLEAAAHRVLWRRSPARREQALLVIEELARCVRAQLASADDDVAG